jgi:hypothetical protein
MENGVNVDILPCTLAGQDNHLKSAHKMEAGKADEKKTVSLFK